MALLTEPTRDQGGNSNGANGDVMYEIGYQLSKAGF